MYFAIVCLLMFALPVASIGYAVGFGGTGFSFYLVGKWFVFWSVGIRLILAGLRQILQPSYTAEVILSLKHAESHLLVRELGFANLGVGLIGAGSVLFPSWIEAGALGGGVFYALAGINHLLQSHRGNFARLAMISDLFVAAVLLTSLIVTLRR